MTELLSVENLALKLPSRDGWVQAVRGIDFSLNRGETLAIVGESGCGKSVSALSLMGLLPERSQVAGSVQVDGEAVLGFSEQQWRQWRGNRIAMIFQNPMTALNPTMRIADQIAEPLMLHQKLSRFEAMQRVEQLLERLQIGRVQERMKQYPFEFSGGMLQRVMIAMAVACDPDILIADEPTTALDVTVQAEVLALLKELQQERNMGLILITHDLAVVAQMAQRVAVMYAGQFVEQGSVEDIFYRAQHPYTLGLKQALPDFHLSDSSNEPLLAIAGSPPDLLSPPVGCGFCPRCPQAMRICSTQAPPLIAHDNGHSSYCWLDKRPENRGMTPQ